MPERERQLPSPVRFGERLVGPSEPVFVVAEAGVNHNGSVETALELVDAAADAGADAVKFQLFQAAELVTAGAAKADYQQQACGGGSQLEMLTHLQLEPGAFTRIRARCLQRNVRFILTPFSIAEVERAVQLETSALKIASTDLNHEPMLRAAVDTGLPLIVSTGAATSDEITAGVRNLLSNPGRSMVPCVDPRGLKPAARRLVLLHCVSCYPTPVDAAHLRAIRTLQVTFGLPAGYSDHTTSTQTGGWAVAAGACILEKHFTLDRSAAGPDHAMSLTPPELAEYVSNARTAQASLGDAGLGMSELEQDVRRAARRSIVARTQIAAGTQITDQMLILKRPGNGLDPGELDRLVGKRAAVCNPADTPLTWDLVQ